MAPLQIFFNKYRIELLYIIALTLSDFFLVLDLARVFSLVDANSVLLLSCVRDKIGHYNEIFLLTS